MQMINPINADTQDEGEIDLSRIWGILVVGKWKIVFFVLATLACASFYLYIAPPIYTADALLQIQSEKSSALQGLDEFTGEASTPAKAEIQIMESRTVLGEAVRKLDLTIVTQPVYFPIIGEAIARRKAPAVPQTEIASAGSKDDWWPNYVWSKGGVEVLQFVMPRSYYNRKFTLRALGAQQFSLLLGDEREILRGEVGSVATGIINGEEISIFVSELTPGKVPADYMVMQRDWVPVAMSLKNKLEILEEGIDTGIVHVTMQGQDRESLATIINAVSDAYVRQNVEARSKQAEKSLEFLDQQLPELRANVEATEDKLADYRKNNQAVDLSSEGQALLTQLVAIEQKRSALELNRTELRQTYTGEHPSLETLDDQMQTLEAEKRSIEKQAGNLPDAQKAILSLKRDVEVSTELYTGLLNRAQELRVVKAGTIGNVRIIDHAIEPVSPIGPNKRMILLLALLLGIILGTIFVLVRAVLRRGINDPSEIENKLGLPVYAVVPHSDWLARESKKAKRANVRAPLLARDNAHEPSVEALRSLRTSLYFAQMEAGSNVVLITGSAPGVGKSFVSVNLAYLLADVDKSVVIVDADMRKGRLHGFLGQERESGLSEILSGQLNIKDGLREIDNTGIKLITTGQIPPNPSELLMRESFTDLLNQLKQEFDLVIVDAPPILAVTDASIMAASIPGIITFLIARAGMHPIAELEECVKRMSRYDSEIAGVVFNGLKDEHVRYAGNYGGYYQYEYKSAEA